MPGTFPYQDGYGPTQAPVCQITVTWGKQTELIDALVDSGASSSAIPVRIAKKMSLKKIGEEKAKGATAKEKKALPIYLVNIKFLGVDFFAHSVFGIEQEIDEEHALIGRDILNRYVTTLDGPNVQCTVA